MESPWEFEEVVTSVEREQIKIELDTTIQDFMTWVRELDLYDPQLYDIEVLKNQIEDLINLRNDSIIRLLDALKVRWFDLQYDTYYASQMKPEIKTLFARKVYEHRSNR